MPPRGVALLAAALPSFVAAQEPPAHLETTCDRLVGGCHNPDARCYHVPDWKMYCNLPSHAGCTAQPLYLSGYYFDHTTCSCREGRYLNTACNIAQQKPVFDSLADCEAVCRPGCQMVDDVREQGAAEFPQMCACYKVARLGLRVPNPFEDEEGWPGKSSCPAPAGCRSAELMAGLRDDELTDRPAWQTFILFILNFVGLLFCFLGLAILCDDFLVPPIEHFCEKYSIPDAAAGASFLAFGSSAPEIVIATISTLSGSSEGEEGSGGDTSLSTVLGSAILAFGLIPAASAVLAPPADSWDVATVPPELYKGGLLLELAPLLRDVVFCIVGFGMIMYFGHDGFIESSEAYFLVFMFFVYMSVIFIPVKLAARRKVNAPASMMDSLEAQADPLPNDDEDDGEPGPVGKIVGRVIELASVPIEFICEHTIPHEPDEGETTSTWMGKVEVPWEKGGWLLGFVVSLFYVAVLSDLILEFAKFCFDNIGMSSELEGVTVLAWGAQVPDCLASISMAKKGLGPGAVANAVGSQIINVFIGLGLPFAIAGKSPISFGGISVYVVCLMVVISMFMLLAVGGMFFNLPWWLGGTSYGSARKAKSPMLTPKAAWILLLVYALCNVVIVLSDLKDEAENGCAR